MREKKINPFVKASVVYFIATVIGQGMTFLGIIVFTRLMSQADYGNYSTYYAYVSIFTVLIGANLFYALNNAYIDKKNEIKEFRKSVLILSTIIMVIMLLIALIVGCAITHQFPSFTVIMGALHSYGFFLINYRMYSANMENDYKTKKWLLALPYALQFLVALIFVLVFPNMTYEARIIGSVLGVGVIAAIAYIEIMKCEGKLIVLDYWKYALGIALPTIIMSISYMLMQQCDKVMITNLCGAEETAVYSVIYYLGYALMAVDQAVAPVRQAWIFRKLDKKDTSETYILQKWYLVIIAILASVLILAGPEIVRIIAPRDYWKYEYIVPFVLSACMMVLYRFYTEVLLFYKKNLWLSASVLGGAIINIILNVLLIPRFGAVAACYTTVVAYGVIFVITKMISNMQAKRLYANRFFASFIVYLIVIATIYSLLVNHILGRYVVLIILFVMCVIYMLRYKREWKSFLGNREA